jgi:hypothetical protein
VFETRALCVPAGNQVYLFGSEGFHTFTSNINIIDYVVSPAVGFAYFALFQGLTGATIGKHLLGLRVVRQDGRKAGVGWAMLRWLLLIVDGACCFLGLFVALASKGHRRIGDMAAGTLVVDRSAVGSPIPVPGLTTALVTPGYVVPAPGASGGWPVPAAPVGAPSPSVTPPPPPADGPQWDAARNTYVQYDPAQAAWVQWDAQAGAWVPISN